MDKKLTSLHSVSVAGVVTDRKSRILAIKRNDTGEWQIPGGVLELGETLQAGLCREILEETGVRVQVNALTGVYKNMVMSVVALVFSCSPLGGNPRTSSESAEVDWLTLEEVNAVFAPVFAIRVADALSGRTWVRNHDGVSLLDS